MGRVKYHIKALSVVMRTTLKKRKKFLSVEKNRFENFHFNFELLRFVKVSRLIAYLSRKNFAFLE